jgi:hypothetical protein
MSTRRIALAAAVASLALPTAAQADDESLFEAYDSSQPGALQTANEHYAAHARRWHKSGGAHKWTKALIADDQKMNAALADIAADVRAENASTSDGSRAKGFALKEIAAYRSANKLEIRGLRQWLGGHRSKAKATLNKAAGIMKNKTYPYGRKAKAAFKAAGYSSKNGAVSE